MVTPPQYSPDGRWWWNGATWLPAPPAPAAYPPAVPWVTAPAVRYAGFWVRLVAFLIDAVLLSVVAVPLNLVLFGNSGAICSTYNYTVTSASASVNGISFSCSPTGAGYLIYFLLGAVYFTLMWRTGATLGQRALKIRVADAGTGKPLSPVRCLVRYVGFCLASIPLAIGLIWAGANSRKQGWHDKMANSVALRGNEPYP